MGGDDPGVLYEQLKEHLQSLRPSSGRQDQDQLTRDVQALQDDYPGFMFSIVTGFRGAAIEALPRAGYTGELVAVIKPDAEGIREALDAALSEPDP